VKILIYSDLHLEFGSDFKPPKDCDADLMILAGDIITFKDFRPLAQFLEGWDKHVIFVAGNHEYYGGAIYDLEQSFVKFLNENAVNVKWLTNSGYNSPHNHISYRDVEFFGGTMWTNFAHSPLAMMTAKQQMNDFKLIYKSRNRKLTPEDTTEFHNDFKENLIAWLEKNKGKKRVVISHHAPCLNPNSKFKGSALQPAFNSLDIVDVIEKYQPDLWIYGHTHECDDQMIGKTRIVSNQRGYPHEICEEFDENKIISLV